VQAANGVTTFRCAGDRFFTVQRNEKMAVVVYSNARYELPRRKSSIGERYAKSGTTLIIDGDMAAFVSGSVIDLDFCRVTA
jgi:hypothetical protein